MKQRSLVIWLAAVLAGAAAAEEPPAIDVATTTSVRDSGLFEELLPLFTRETGIEVRLVALGSGAALRMGEEGNADALVTHDPKGEEALIASGALVDRRPLMSNFFLIAGPPEDPAGLRSANIAGLPSYPSRWPRKELDFILYGQGIVPKGFDIPTVPLSDHLPLVFDFEVDPDFVRAPAGEAAAKA